MNKIYKYYFFEAALLYGITKNNYYFYNKPYCKQMFPIRVSGKYYIYDMIFKSAHSETVKRMKNILYDNWEYSTNISKESLDESCIFKKRNNKLLNIINNSYHLTFVREPVSHLLAGFEEIDDYYNRRPDRLRQAKACSADYNYIRKKGVKKSYKSLFKAMIIDILNATHDKTCRYYEMLYHIIPQTYGLQTHDETININFIGKLESYQDSWNKFLNSNSLKERKSYKRKITNPSGIRRKSKKIDYRIFINDKKLTKAICLLLSQDYELLNYTKPNFCLKII